ncbi:TOMM precursor leader peptide-binding protein [Myxococcaceae bacterium JPH2]|nr:TOMM precursor leader peptide-binding protein [Myxococcaceae bacterium JPH2]
MRDAFDRVLRFPPHLRLEILDEQRALLMSEREQFLLTGTAQIRAAPLLDGQRTVREVLAALATMSPPVPRQDALYAIMRLEQRGHLVEVVHEGDPAVTEYWHATGVAPHEARTWLSASPVSVLALDGLESGPWPEALTGSGLTVREDSPLRVVLVRDYLSPELEAWVRAPAWPKAPWLLVKPSGTSPWVGPVFRGAENPCWACLAHRLRRNRPVLGFLEAQNLRKGRPHLTALPTSIQAAASFAALALARWVASGGQGTLSNTLFVLEPHKLHLTEHRVVRRPQCPACGDAGLLAARARQPLVLEARPRRTTDDNGFRGVTPEETFARHEHLISPLTGVLSSLGPVEGRNHPLRPVFGAAYFTQPETQRPSVDDFHAMSAGKGRTPAQSRASALCEGLERVSAMFQGDEPRVKARLTELGDAAVHPRDVLLFSDAQYRDREALSARYGATRRAVPEPFDAEQPVDWTPVWSLTHERLRYLPTALCYARYPHDTAPRFGQQDSNGHAAGNSVEEAILQGFLELAERDAVALWWYNRLRRPGVDLESFGEPYFAELVEHHRGHGWRLWALDLTHDLGIPTFVALGRAPDAGRFCVGFGAHLDARLALMRALTEFNQLFDPSAQLPPPWDAAALDDLAFLFPDETQASRVRADFAPVPLRDLREDVLDCVARAARVGLETLVLDQTRPDIGLSVVKVTVPGLRHFWPRLGPGRLYDVPVRLGWRDAPLDEARLNPVPLFL